VSVSIIGGGNRVPGENNQPLDISNYLVKFEENQLRHPLNHLEF
jgi:hypothetical protein